MKLKGCLTTIGLLIVVLLGISFFLPKEMNTAVSRDLEASPEQIFAQVNNAENWKNWSPWFNLDPDMEVTYGEKTIGEGASYAWKSEKKMVGVGAMIIGESITNEKVGTILKFDGEEDSYADINISPNEGGGSTVLWDFESEYHAQMPWQRFQMTFYRMMLKDSYNKGLTAIDEYIKANPEAHLAYVAETGNSTEIEIEELDVEGFNAVTVVRKGTIAEMMENGHNIYGGAFGEVAGKIEAEGLEMTGYPLAFGNLWDEEAGLFEIEIGIPVTSGGKSIEGGRALKADFYGPYEGIEKAHEALHQYMEANGLSLKGAPWENYVTDPGTELDTSKWLTEVFYLVNE